MVARRLSAIFQYLKPPIDQKYINLITSMISMATTISISKEMKEKLKNLGRTGDSYEDVIRRMYEFTSKNLMARYLYDESDSVQVSEAIAEARKKWPK